MAIVHVVVCVVQGCAESAQAFTESDKADEAAAEAKKILGVIEGQEEESERCVEVFYNVPLK